ncbi:MAG: hypothetical protein K6C10_01520 [Prevotella sp.]|nr:hypothetical protein [Prevotella sp.]
MSKEEKFLIENFGKQNHFRVPEGYFDDFADKLMASLPEREEQQAKVVEMKPKRKFVRYAVAAAFAVLIAGVGVQFARNSQDNAEPVKMAATQYESPVDQMADYVMIDNGDIYAYVSGY